MIEFQFKCKHSVKENFICVDCIKLCFEQRNKLLNFVQSIADLSHPAWENQFGVEIELMHEAWKLMKDIIR